MTERKDGDILVYGLYHRWKEGVRSINQDFKCSNQLKGATTRTTLMVGGWIQAQRNEHGGGILGK